MGALNACGDDSGEIECGHGIQNVQLATWEEVWKYCGNQYSLGLENNEVSYVMCPATCTEGPQNCERKISCHDIVYSENGEDAKTLRTHNNCTGNGAAVCQQKL